MLVLHDFVFPSYPLRAESGAYLRQAMMELLGKACCCDFWPGLVPFIQID